MPITPVITLPIPSTLLGDAATEWNTNDTNLKNAIVSLSTTVDGMPTTTILTTHKNSSDHDAHNDARYAALATTVRRQHTIWGSIGATGFMKLGGYETSAALGVPISEAGAVTRVTWMRNDGTVESLAMAYSSSAANHFSAGSRVTVEAEAASKDVTTYINSGVISGLSDNGASKTVVLVGIQITYDA